MPDCHKIVLMIYFTNTRKNYSPILGKGTRGVRLEVFCTSSWKHGHLDLKLRTSMCALR